MSPRAAPNSRSAPSSTTPPAPGPPTPRCPAALPTGCPARGPAGRRWTGGRWTGQGCRATGDARGVVVVVSAGNDHRGVAHQSPANVPDAVTVSSLSDADGKPGGLGRFAWCNKNNRNRDDTLSDFSNFGRGVDIAAPGACRVPDTGTRIELLWNSAD
ncbi:S8 family serine peptidase [Kitasatospora sp. NPDC058406]|uniref:S8 family serine peptidase n=1 Tax=Kitasatospora sp. NPDC058406 TaxID=3346483 RepID=UPI0036609939